MNIIFAGKTFIRDIVLLITQKLDIVFCVTKSTQTFNTGIEWLRRGVSIKGEKCIGWQGQKDSPSDNYWFKLTIIVE